MATKHHYKYGRPSVSRVTIKKVKALGKTVYLVNVNGQMQFHCKTKASANKYATMLRKERDKYGGI